MRKAFEAKLFVKSALIGVMTASVANIAFARVDQSQLSSYRKQAKELLQLVANNAPATDVSSKAKQLVDTAKPIVQAYLEKNPQCSEYLSITLREADSMQQLSVAQLEEDFHKGAKLPKGTRDCYNAKDLIVHPASVVAMVRGEYTEPVKNGIRHEITEVIQHLEQVKGKL